MKYFVASLLLFSVISFGAVPQSAAAATPPEILSLYKAYKTAGDEGRYDDAAQYAYDAWQKSEKMVGDSKLTGDLASNFALLAPRNFKGRDSRKLVINAYERSIDLTEGYGEDSAVVELQRRVDFLSWAVSRRISLGRDYDLGELEKKVVALGYEGTTFDAESKALKAQKYAFEKKWKAVEIHGSEAMALYEAVDDNVISYLRYLVPIYLADSFENRKDPIKAAMIYQDLLTDLDKHNAHDNTVSGNAYAEWLRLRDEILDDYSDDPRSDIIRNFTVPDGRQAELLPLVRIPPYMPTSFVQGSHSGKVELMFDLDINGRVVNPKVTASTSKSLHKPALKSLEGWRYTPNAPEDKRKGITSTITFELMSQSGRLLPMDELKSRD